MYLELLPVFSTRDDPPSKDCRLAHWAGLRCAAAKVSNTVNAAAIAEKAIRAETSAARRGLIHRHCEVGS